jgi:hypothetical protein
MTLADIKRETKDAWKMECVYRSANQHGDINCLSDRCFYWNDLDTHVVKTNMVFHSTIIKYIEDPYKIGAYEIKNGVLQFTVANELTKEREVKVVEKQQQFFKELIARNEGSYDNIYFDEEEQLFYTRQKREERIGYCMKVAKELNLI